MYCSVIFKTHRLFNDLRSRLETLIDKSINALSNFKDLCARTMDKTLLYLCVFLLPLSLPSLSFRFWARD